MTDSVTFNSMEYINEGMKYAKGLLDGFFRHTDIAFRERKKLRAVIEYDATIGLTEITYEFLPGRYANSTAIE